MCSLVRSHHTGDGSSEACPSCPGQTLQINVLVLSAEPSSSFTPLLNGALWIALADYGQCLCCTGLHCTEAALKCERLHCNKLLNARDSYSATCTLIFTVESALGCIRQQCLGRQVLGGYHSSPSQTSYTH